MSGRSQAEIAVSLAVLVLLTWVAPVVAQQYTFTHFAGSTGGYGSADGTGSSAGFYAPGGIAVDTSGNVYVADTNNHTIRKITSAGVVTTLAGLAGVYGSTDGNGSVARFAYPEGIAIDGSGNVYVGDYGNSAIRKITPAGIVSTLAGALRTPGFKDGTGSAAQFNGPWGVAVDGSGNVYVADNKNYAIRKITAAGVVTTLAGNGTYGFPGDGTGTAAQFFDPRGVFLDSAGNLYVADGSNYVRKITPAAVVTTVPASKYVQSNGVVVDASGTMFIAGIRSDIGYVFQFTAAQLSTPETYTTLAGGKPDQFSDGTGSAAGFYVPSAIAIDGSGNLFVADSGNNNIRKVTPAGVVTTLAGKPPAFGYVDATGTAARFRAPAHLATDPSGNIFLDDDYEVIRKITPAAVVTTFAGNPNATSWTDGTGTAASFGSLTGIGANSSGALYVADNTTIRAITPTAVVTTLAGQNQTFGEVDGTGSTARFGIPEGVAVDSHGNVFVSDPNSDTIRRVTPAGVVTTFAGAAFITNVNPKFVDGTGTAARFNGPTGLAIDANDNIYVADSTNCAIRKITPAAVVTTMAGGTCGSADGIGSAAQFGLGYKVALAGVAVDAAGNIYAADTANQMIRKITQAGVVTTVAGRGATQCVPGGPCVSSGISGNSDGTGDAALFNKPLGLAIDGSGNMYVADSGNNCIRKGVPAIGDTATIDASSGQPGTMRLLGVSPNTASTWLWEEIRRPSASAASLSSTSTPNPSFTPDVAGLYVFRLTASSSAGARVSTVSLSIGLIPGGDINGDGAVNTGDVFYLINNLFAGGPAPVGPGDVNGDGHVDAADVIYLINYLFVGGTAPH